jgi:hypothetical protein
MLTKLQTMVEKSTFCQSRSELNGLHIAVTVIQVIIHHDVHGTGMKTALTCQ